MNSEAHRILETKRNFYQALYRYKLILERDYHIKMGRLHKIPECCINFWLDAYPAAADADRKIRKCPDDYVHCPVCCAKELQLRSKY